MSSSKKLPNKASFCKKPKLLFYNVDFYFMKLSAQNSIGERIKYCAELAGSGDELSRKTGIPRRTLESYFTDESEPKIGRVTDIAKSVGVSLNWLATGEGTPDGDCIQTALTNTGFSDKAVTAAASALYDYLEKDKSRLNSFVFGETVALLCRLKPDGDIDSDLIKTLMNFKTK